MRFFRTAGTGIIRQRYLRNNKGKEIEKGIRGGYTLACSPGYVTLADILNALDISVLEEMEIHDSSGGTLDSIP